MSVKGKTAPAAGGGGKKPLQKVSEKSKTPMKKKPVKKGVQDANQAARLAMATGDIVKDEVARKQEQDNRTLYIRFSDKLPETTEQIKGLHTDIKFIRTPRTSTKGGKGIGYAFLEFEDQEACKEAKNRLATTQYKGKEVYVDFVGENSKNKKAGAGPKTQLNPTRLFVVGLAPGVTKTNLKEMFPKASHADIPQKSRNKGTSFGFVQFATPGDAKAAFDAAKDLAINGHKITVLFAKKNDQKEEVLKKKAEKRKAKQEEKKSKKGEGETEVGGEEKKPVKKQKVEEEEEDEGEDSEEDKSMDVSEAAENEESNDEDDDEEEDGEDSEVKEKSEGADEDDDDDDEDDEDEDGEDNEEGKSTEASEGADDEESEEEGEGADEDDDDNEDDDEDGDELEDTVEENKGEKESGDEEGESDEEDDDDDEDGDEEEEDEAKK